MPDHDGVKIATHWSDSDKVHFTTQRQLYTRDQVKKKIKMEKWKKYEV